MKLGFKVHYAVGCLGILSFSCGFAPPPSQSIGADVIVTAAPIYEELAAVHGGERFPHGARLLLIHNGTATPLLPGFAGSADASVSFDGSAVLFSGRKDAGDAWQIYELTLSDRKVRRISESTSDAIRPLYLPGWRLVYAQKSGAHFQMISARLADTEAIQEIEGKGVPTAFPISFAAVSAIPSDVMADGRILFESGFPLGEGGTPELYLAYSDGSGVESYRCDHPTKELDARYGGHQLTSGDVVFTHGARLARFSSPMAQEEGIPAPPADYAGRIAEAGSGDWLFSVRKSVTDSFALKLWRPGSPGLRSFFAQTGSNLIDPVLVAARNRPRRHPSALHDWDYANLLALDTRISRDGPLTAAPASVRLETRDDSGRAVTMGTAPVEADGSFFVKAPADRPIRFALLDARGEIIRQEHGWFWSRRGEQRYCVGCHAGPEHAPENRVPAVLTRTTMPVDLTGTASQQPQRGGN
ncbi:hypothetical protein [Occallatibacter savannae]|uniref:HzsA-related protein n=1 Tax=Occallatibacter savannae TaxID=1002691 RepID=UPI000D69F688|nr:hypothetical protein [Occallatibacter savannae]